MASLVDVSRNRMVDLDFSSKPWEQGSLHPAILGRIERVLAANPHVGYLRYTYDHPMGNVGSKLDFLQQHRDEIAPALITRSPGSPSDTFPTWNTFYVAKTLTFKTHDAFASGLATIFVDADRPISDEEKILLLAKLGYQKPASHKEGDRLAQLGEKVASKKAIGGMKFGAQSSIDLSALGAQPGVVGPWKLSSALTPIYIISTDLESNMGGAFDIFDFALTTTESLLVRGMNQSLALIREVAKLGQYEDSLHVIKPATHS